MSNIWNGKELTSYKVRYQVSTRSREEP